MSALNKSTTHSLDSWKIRVTPFVCKTQSFTNTDTPPDPRSAVGFFFRMYSKLSYPSKKCLNSASLSCQVSLSEIKSNDWQYFLKLVSSLYFLSPWIFREHIFNLFSFSPLFCSYIVLGRWPSPYLTGTGLPCVSSYIRLSVNDQRIETQESPLFLLVTLLKKREKFCARFCHSLWKILGYPYIFHIDFVGFISLGRMYPVGPIKPFFTFLTKCF